ncbi:MAG: ABC transporter permease [Treponema sp.]|nr:ABC transporter permease [Treponema sp.]
MTGIQYFVKKNQTIFLSYLTVVFMVVAMSIIRPEFGSLGHIRMMLIDASVLGILALGLTFVIITGGIDLSLQWTLNVAAIVLTMAYKNNPNALIFIVPLVLLGGTLVGLINGFGVAYLELNPMIMTFGMNVILQGGLLAITKGRPGEYAPKAIRDFVLGDSLILPNMFFFWLILIVTTTLILTRTPFGRRVYAIGNSDTVAYYSGVNTRFTKMMCYCLSSATSALGGILLVGRFQQSYLGMGDFIVFQAIAVVAVGGTSLSGGTGSYAGTVAGAFIITILTSLLSAIKMPTSLQQIVYGIILIFSVIVSSSKVRKESMLK